MITGEPCAVKAACTVREGADGKGPDPRAPRRRPTSPSTSTETADLREFAATRDWPTIYYLPPYAPDLNPVEGVWSLLRRGWLSKVAFATPGLGDPDLRFHARAELA